MTDTTGIETPLTRLTASLRHYAAECACGITERSATRAGARILGEHHIGRTQGLVHVVYVTGPEQ